MSLKSVIVTSANVQSNTQDLTSLSMTPFASSEDSFVTLSPLVLSQEIGPTSIKLEISGPPFQELSLIDHNIILTHLDEDNSSKLDFTEEAGAVGDVEGKTAWIIWSLTTSS